MKLRVTVHGVAYEVEVEVLDPGEGFPAPRTLPVQRPKENGPAAAPPPHTKSPTPTASDGGSVTSPIAGTVVEIKCKIGDDVTKDQILLVIEAMKMKTSIAAPTAGKVKAIPVAVGDSVRESQTLVEFN